MHDDVPVGLLRGSATWRATLRAWSTGILPQAVRSSSVSIATSSHDEERLPVTFL